MPRAALANGKPESSGFEASFVKATLPLAAARLLCGLRPWFT